MPDLFFVLLHNKSYFKIFKWIKFYINFIYFLIIEESMEKQGEIPIFLSWRKAQNDFTRMS